MTFSFDIPLAAAILLVLGALAGLAYVTWLLCRSRRLKRFVEHDEPTRDYAELLPAVSVIVDACNEVALLPQFLPMILAQDYPEFEVIVVVNSSAEATGGLLSELKLQHPGLHVTFIPHHTRTLSRTKLALMIGIKAAKHDIVLTTSSNCTPTGHHWLQTMMRNFTPETGIVLGYAHYDHAHDRRWGSSLRTFDSVSTGAQWLLAAIGGHPYRGTSDNLAYRKQLFFDNRGFARCMELRWGEDDVFLSQIAQGTVTRVELDAESQMVVHYENMRHAHRLLKMRRDFTSQLVRRKSFVVQALMSWMWWLGLLALVAAVVVAWPNALVAALACGVLLLLWCGASWSWGCIVTVLQAPKQLLCSPLLALWRPLVNLVYRWRERKNRHSNYTSYI